MTVNALGEMVLSDLMFKNYVLFTIAINCLAIHQQTEF
jgi:hypothetical protein